MITNRNMPFDFSWHGFVQSENFHLTYCIHTCVHVCNMNICIFINLRLVQWKIFFLTDVLAVAVISPEWKSCFNRGTAGRTKSFNLFRIESLFHSQGGWTAEPVDCNFLFLSLDLAPRPRLFLGSVSYL